MLNLLKYHKKHVPLYESKPYILFESVILLFLHVVKSIPLNVWNVSYASIIYWTWYNVLLCNSFQLYSVFVAAAKCPIGFTGKYCESQCQFPDYGYGCQQSCICSKQRCNFATGCTSVKSNNISSSLYLIKFTIQNFEMQPLRRSWYLTHICCFVLEFISKTTTQKSLSINVRLNRTLVSLNTVSTMDVLKQGIHGFYLQILEGKQRW